MTPRRSSLAALGLLLTQPALLAQNPSLIHDVNQTGPLVSSHPDPARGWLPGHQFAGDFLQIGSWTYFRAKTIAEGSELWRTTGGPPR